MKIMKDEIMPYKLLRKRSPLPFLVAGITFLLIGAMTPMVSPMHYIRAGLFALLGYIVGRGIWPDAKVKLELAPDTGDKQADQLLSEAREALVAIRGANDRIEDPDVSQCIDGIEASCIAILSRLEEQPALHGQLRTFLRYYLPTTRKILDARASLAEGGLRVESELRVAARADRVLPEIQRAFERQLEAIDKHRFLDLQVEMDVLEGMLKSDGLIDARP